MRTPSREKASSIARRSRGSTPSIVRSLPVTAARPMKLPTSMCSGPIRHVAAAEALDAADAEQVRGDPVDLRAERDEEAAEILDVRLAGGVRDHRLAGREDGGHDRVLGRHHARLVEEDRRRRAGRRCASRSGCRSRSRRRAPGRRGCAGRGGGGRSRRRPAAARSRGRGGRAAGRRAGTRRGSARRGRRAPRAAESPVGSTRTSFSPVHSASAPRLARSSTIVSTSRIRGTLASVTGPSASSGRREDRQRAVLVAGGADRPVQRHPAFDDEGFGDGGAMAIGPDILAGPLTPTREQAWETLTRYTKSESLLRHALAVEASTAAYARKLGGDEELWRVAALLHDFDYEIHPTLDKHPQDGAPILREEGYPEEVVETVLSHAEHLGLPRDTPLKKALFACDELSGLRPRVRARAPDRARGARAEVGAQEAEAAVVRRGRAPRGRLQGRRGARRRARRPHPHGRRGARSRSPPSSASRPARSPTPSRPDTAGRARRDAPVTFVPGTARPRRHASVTGTPHG